MTRRSMFFASLLLLVAVPASNIARAGNLLEAVPDGAVALTIVNRLAETDGKIQATAKRLQAPVPGMLATLKVAAGVRDGVDEQGSAALVLMPADAKKSGGEPVMLLLLPVTDFDKFIAQLSPEDASAEVVKVQIFGGPYLAIQRGEFALLGDVGQEGLLKKIAASKQMADADLAPLRAWVGKNDITGIVTPKGVRYFTNVALTELRKAKAEMAEMPDEMKEMMASAVAMFEFYEKILEAVSSEVSVAAAGARLEKQGDLRIAARVRLNADGDGAKALAGAEPLDFDPLAHLPGEPFVFAFGGVFPESLTELSMRLSTQLMQSGAFPFGDFGGNAGKLMEMSKESMKGLRGMSMVLGVGTGDEPLYGRMMGVMHVDDAAGYMANYRKVMEEFVNAQKGDGKSVFKGMEVEETRVGDVKGLKVSMEIPLPPGMDDIPELRKMMEQMMEKMYGKGGKIRVFIAPAGERDVVMSYTSPEPAVAMLRTIKQGQKGLSGDPQLKAASAMLPAERLATMFWSPKGTFAFAKRMIAVFSAMGAGGAPQIPEFPDAPAVGGVISKGPAEVRFDLIVPAKTIDVGGEYIQQLMAM